MSKKKNENEPDELSIPQYMMDEFLKKFRPCQPDEDPDEKFTTTELFQLFNEHVDLLFPADVSEAMVRMGFNSSLDTGRMQYLWNLKNV
jgi:hypothetical protein